VFNNTKKAWILGRNVRYWRYGKPSEQIAILKEETLSEGYSVAGISKIYDAIDKFDSKIYVKALFKAVMKKKIDAVFVMSIRHISENLEVAFRFVDFMNNFGVVVYDVEGVTYSYDWVCKERGLSFPTRK